MDLPAFIIDGVRSAMLGLLLSLSVGPHFTYRSLARHHTQDIPTLHSLRRPRAQVRQRYLNGAVSITDVITHLQSSLRGWDFLNSDADRVMLMYCHEYRLNEIDGGDPDAVFFRDVNDDSNDAAHAVLHWIYRCPDWDLLLTCLRAGLTPTELRNYADDTTTFTREQVEFLAALRTATDEASDSTADR
jgi:hypothetical protein